MATLASPFIDPAAAPLSPLKFRDPEWTAKGEPRATVTLGALKTLWFNTGTLCNLACTSCYIESSPTNDALSYLTLAEVDRFLDEIDAPIEIGFTGGEPFMNPEIMAMLDHALGRGHHVLVLSNAMRPMRRHEAAILALAARFPGKLTVRVSLDHHTQAVHEQERGPQELGPRDRGSQMARRQRRAARGRGPAAARRKRGGLAHRLCGAVRAAWRRSRRPRPIGARPVPGNGCRRRRRRNQRGMLGRARADPGIGHVLVEPDDRPPQGPAGGRSRGLHLAALRRAIPAWRDAWPRRARPSRSTTRIARASACSAGRAARDDAQRDHSHARTPAMRLLSCLASLSDADEIIVADGGSTDATPAIARAAGATIVNSERGRGVQLAKGAAVARGDALLFVHADTRLSPGWRTLAETAPGGVATAGVLSPQARRFRLAGAADRARRLAPHAPGRPALWRPGPARVARRLRCGGRVSARSS